MKVIFSLFLAFFEFSHFLSIFPKGNVFQKFIFEKKWIFLSKKSKKLLYGLKKWNLGSSGPPRSKMGSQKRGHFLAHFWTPLLRPLFSIFARNEIRINSSADSFLAKKVAIFGPPLAKKWGGLVTPYLWDFSKMTPFLDIFGPPSEKSKREFGAFLKKAGF